MKCAAFRASASMSGDWLELGLGLGLGLGLRPNLEGLFLREGGQRVERLRVGLERQVAVADPELLHRRGEDGGVRPLQLTHTALGVRHLQPVSK